MGHLFGKGSEPSAVAHLYWGLKKIEYQAYLVFCFFGNDKNISFKKLSQVLLSNYFILLISLMRFRMEENIHTQTVLEAWGVLEVESCSVWEKNDLLQRGK